MSKKVIRIMLSVFAIMATANYLSGCAVATGAAVAAGTAGIMVAGANEVAEGQTKGTNFDESQVQKIVKGRTTESELIKMFGTPDQSGMSGDGKNLMWKRQEMKSEASSGMLSLLSFKPNVKMKILMVQLNRKGLVQDFTFNTQ